MEVLWSDDTIRIGPATVTEQLAGTCTRYVAEGGSANLPDAYASAMARGEVLIVAEVCARLARQGSLSGRFIAGDIYRYHALPARDRQQAPVSPSYTQRVDPDTTAFLNERWGAATPPPLAPASAFVVPRPSA